jgi:RNA polymerase sigma-70 factor (ECF subfamily)
VPVELEAAADDVAAVDWNAVTAAFRAGDAEAADAVARRLLPYVANLVRRLAAWRSDVDDLTQDVLVTALAKRRSFRGDAKLETWITRIAVNACRAHARKRWLRKQLFASWAERSTPHRSTEHAPADAAATDNEQLAIVRDAVARLPAKSREAIVLCYLQHLTPTEAAAALGVRPGTLEVRLCRARDQLRKLLEHER